MLILKHRNWRSPVSPRSKLPFSNMLVLALLMLSFGTAVFAQAGRGGISGLISDSSGGAVPQATVALRNTATGAAQTTATTGAGLYSFVSLPPGTYQISAKHAGFDTAVQTNVLVSVD